LSRPVERRLALVAAIAACLTAPACSRREPQTVLVGRHELRLVTPRGWEHLDHGRQQLFRVGESELALEDLGPATPEGLTNELREAEQLLHDGRRADALARVRTLHGLPISLSPWQARADFWSPWTDVTYNPDIADDATLGRALEHLIRNAGALPAVSMDQLVEHVLTQSHQGSRREIARKEARDVHGADWVAIETWDRVSHMNRQRLACLEAEGYLLTLSTRRGQLEVTGAAFDSLLASIELSPSPP